MSVLDTANGTIEQQEAELNERDEFGFTPEPNPEDPPEPEYAFDDTGVDPNPPENNEGEAAAGNEPGGDDTQPTDDKKDEKGGSDDADKPLSRSDWGEYGLTEDEAKNLDANGALDTTLNLFDRKMLEVGREAAKGQGDGGNKPPVDQGNTQQQTANEAATEDIFKLDSLDDFDEALVKQLSGVAEHINRQHTHVQSLEKQLSEVTELLQSQQQAAFEERMDTYYASLGDDYAEILGKGPTSGLAPNSPAKAKRDEIAENMAALAAGYASFGRKVPSEQVLRERASRMVLGEYNEALARKKVAQQARNAQGQFVSKPTHRDGKPLSGTDRAAKRLDDKYKEKGLL